MEQALQQPMPDDMEQMPEPESEEMNIDFILNSINIADTLDDEYLRKLGSQIVEDVDHDKASRQDWERRYEEALKLAAQVVEAKTYPWPGAANIKYPLLTTACVQFSARAYPALIPGTDVVKCRTIGFDATGDKEGRAIRIGKHMSYQILEEMEEWEEDMDRLLVMLPVTGTEFKKTYFDPNLGRNVSQHVLAKDLIVNYWARSLETAPRKTHVLYMSENEIRERVLRGMYREFDIGSPPTQTDRLREIGNKIQGLTEPQQDQDTPHEVLECHCWWDLDDDGYREPYIVTVHRETKQIFRIAARFDAEGVETRPDGKIVRITPVEYFTKFSFIPSIDGGFYDFGWGLLLGPINETVNSTINQLLDAGTLSNMQAGFLARGIRVRGGNMSFQPGEWKVVDTTGDDLRKGIVPLPTQQPSQVLFQLLGLMVESGQKLANVVDILLGENPGQNQPATTTLAVIEQGLKVFTAVYKRLYRALKKEYRKLYRLNRIFLPDQVYFSILDPGQEQAEKIQRSDYKGDPNDVIPAADPNVVSDAQRLTRAEALVGALANGAPLNPLEVWRRYLEAMLVPGIDSLLPNEMPKPPPDPKMLEVELKAKAQQFEEKIETLNTQIATAKTQAEISKMRADAVLAIAKAEAEQGGLQLEQYNLLLEKMALQQEAADNAAQRLLERDIAELQADTQLQAAKARQQSKPKSQSE
jgi:chaperonin GroES